MGVPFLDKIPAFAATYGSARLYVEMAFGAPAPVSGETESSWTWVDVTDDVMQDGSRNIAITAGRSDWVGRTQPAGCTFALDNRSGNYSQGPQSIYYPKIRPNIPVKVSIALDGVYANRKIRFQGYTSSMQPSFDPTGRFAIVTVAAAGLTRRLQLRNTPLQSPMRRAFEKDTGATVVDYWPMEDDEDADTLTNAIPNRQPMTFESMSLSSYSGITGSQPFPTFDANSRYNAYVKRSFTTGVQVDFHMFKQSAPSGDTAIMRLHFTGSSGVERWEVVLVGGSSTNIRMDGYSGSSVAQTDAGSYTTVYNVPIHLSFRTRQNGGNVEWKLTRYFSLGGTSVTRSGSFAGTRGHLFRIDMLPDADNASLALGHVVVYDAYDYVQPGNPTFGWVGDTAETRIAGLCGEENIPVTYTDNPTDDRFTRIGAQGTLSFLDLVREANDADMGILDDGFQPGLRYLASYDRYDLAATMTLDVSAGNLSPNFEPQDDDESIINKSTITRKGGGSSTSQITAGTNGTAAIGVYEESESLNYQFDSQTEWAAEFRTGAGTLEGYRYPALSIDWRRNVSKASSWVSSKPGIRIDVTGVKDYVTQLPQDDIRLVVEGWSERISRFVWESDLNCSPFEAWDVAQLATDSGDTSEFVGRLDAKDSTLVTSVSAGATSLQLSANQYWTTKSDDFPLDLKVGGWKTTASAIVGPWTFVAFGTSAAADAAAINPGLPTGWQQGDLLLTFHATRDTTFTSIPQTPSGYTQLWTSANMRICAKYATSSESSPTLTYSGGAGDTCLGIMAAVRPSTTVSGFTVGNTTQLNSSAQDVAVLGLTSSALNEVKMYFAWKADDASSAGRVMGFDNVAFATSTLGNDATIMVGVQPFKEAYTMNDTTITVTGGAAAVSRTIVGAVRSTTDPVQVATVSAMPAAVSSGATIEVARPHILGM